MSSMVESLMGSLGGDNLGAIMEMLGGDDGKPDEGATKAAIGGGLGAILGGLASNAADPAGAESLLNAVKSKHDGGVLDDVGGFLGMGDGVDGGKILGHVFGSNKPQVEAKIAESSGLDVSKITKLLPMLAPLVMGWLGKKASGGGLNASGLGGLLQGERQSAESAMPDLGGLLGSLGGLLGGGSGVGGAASGATKSAGGILDMLKSLFGSRR